MKKTQIESHCTDNESYNGNEDTQVTKDTIQEQPYVTFANEEMLKSNEKILIESHHTNTVSYNSNKDTDVALVKEESIKIMKNKNESDCTDNISNDRYKDTGVTLVKEEPN